MGCVDYHNSTRHRGLARDLSERPFLACLTSSGGGRVERKMDAPLCSWQKDCAPLAVVTGRHMLARSVQLTSQDHPAQVA